MMLQGWMDHRFQSATKYYPIPQHHHLTITISWWRWLVSGRLGLTNWSKPRPTALLIFCKAFCRLKPKMEELPVEVKGERPKVLEPWVSWDSCHSDMPWKVNQVFRFNGKNRPGLVSQQSSTFVECGRPISSWAKLGCKGFALDF